MSPLLKSKARELNINRKGIDFVKPWPRHVIEAITGQISVELWQMLTLNVPSLSHIRLSQWQQIFDIIAIASGGDAFSAGKAYEVRKLYSNFF
jgi:hypothetical protein